MLWQPSGCSAIQVLLNSTLMANVTEQSQAMLAVALVDCLVCYDSVRHPPVYIAYQHLGSPQPLLKTVFYSIQNMCIFLCTAFGDSPLPTAALPLLDPHSKVSAKATVWDLLWLATSIPLIKMFWSHGHVSKFSCLISGWKITLTGIIYMDSCNLLVFLPASDATKAAITAFQHNILRWQGGFQATGVHLWKCGGGSMGYFCW